MRVRFWGTRGSIAKPGPDTLRYGGNTSCVEVRAPDGTLIVLDCGTGAHGLGLALEREAAARKPAQGHLLISHTHWDHIQGFPFFSPLRQPEGNWDVYGPLGLGSSLRETLAGQMSYTYFPVDLSGLDARVDFHELVEGVFELGDVRVEARYLNHPAVTLGYRIEAAGVVMVYATDHEPHSRQLALGEEPSSPTLDDDAHATFLEGADLVIHDTQYTAAEYPRHAGWGHSTVEYVVDRTRDKGVGKVALFHHDPLRDDDSLDRLVAAARDRYASAKERVDVLAAAEGLTLDLEARPRRARSVRSAGLARQTPPVDAKSQSLLLCARAEANLEVFRQAAAADGLPLAEAGDLNRAVALVGAHPPTVVVFEWSVLGPDRQGAVRRLRNAFTDVAAEPPVMLCLASREEKAGGEALPGVEMVETPVSAQWARTRLRASLLRTICRWRRASPPADEDRRLQALRDLHLLDTPPEERIDRYTRIAARLFRVPTVLVSLVDADRQWFKSSHGLEAKQTPRDQAFCAHAILDADIFEVRDARAHPDFADNPLVQGPPFVRFYAGIPLKVQDDLRVGTLCLIDYYPRALDASERALLRDLGTLVEQELATALEA